MKSLRYILLLVITLTGSVAAYCQQNSDLVNAYNCVGRKNVDSAKYYIDRAIQKDSNVRKDPQYWYVRGFVYKELYKKYEATTKQSVYRDTSVADLFKSAKIDTSAENKKSN